MSKDFGQLVGWTFIDRDAITITENQEIVATYATLILQILSLAALKRKGLRNTADHT